MPLPYKVIPRKGGALHVWAKAPRAKTNVHPTSKRVFVPTPKKKRPPVAPAPPGAPVAPALAPAPVTPAAPPDPSYLGQVEALGRTRTADLGQVAAQRQQGLLGYGYTEGAGGALSIDPNNPFSKAALLKQNYNQSRARAGQTMGAGGQLYAGAYQNQQDFLNRGQLQSEDTLQKSLADFLARNTGARARAQTDYELGVARAAGESTGRIETNPLYEPTATAPDVLTAQKNPQAAAEFIRPSAAHGGKKWVYRKGASGRPIPIRPA